MFPKHLRLRYSLPYQDLIQIVILYCKNSHNFSSTNKVTGRSLGAKSGTKSPGRTKASPIVQDPDSAPRKKVKISFQTV